MSQDQLKVVEVLEQHVKRMAPDVGAILKTSTPEEAAEVLRRVNSVLVTMARRKPDDFEAIMNSPIGRESIRTVVMTCLETGLYIGTYQPHAWAIPRMEKGKMRLNWQASARGLAFLAHRAGYTLAVDLVMVGDKAVILHPQGTYERTITADWRPAQTGNMPILELVTPRGGDIMDRLAGALIVARDESARVVNWRWCGIDEIRRRRAVSKSGNIWNDWPAEMAEKTAIIYAISRGICPTTTELRSVLEHDAEDTIDVSAETVRPAPSAVPEPRQIAAPPIVDDFAPEEEEERRQHREPSPREKLEIRADESGMPLAAYLGSLGWTKPPDAMTDADAERLLSARAK